MNVVWITYIYSIRLIWEFYFYFKISFMSGHLWIETPKSQFNKKYNTLLEKSDIDVISGQKWKVGLFSPPTKLFNKE